MTRSNPAQIGFKDDPIVLAPLWVALPESGHLLVPARQTIQLDVSTSLDKVVPRPLYHIFSLEVPIFVATEGNLRIYRSVSSNYDGKVSVHHLHEEIIHLVFALPAFSCFLFIELLRTIILGNQIALTLSNHGRIRSQRQALGPVVHPKQASGLCVAS
jgi:hypothetical protein